MPLESYLPHSTFFINEDELDLARLSSEVPSLFPVQNIDRIDPYALQLSSLILNLLLIWRHCYKPSLTMASPFECIGRMNPTCKFIILQQDLYLCIADPHRLSCTTHSRIFWLNCIAYWVHGSAGCFNFRDDMLLRRWIWERYFFYTIFIRCVA